MPRGVTRATEVNGILVGFLKLLPMGPHGEIVHLKFPILARIIDAGLKTLTLFFAADMQEKFQDDNAVRHQSFFKSVNLLKTFSPYMRRLQFHDTNDQHILIMRAVEKSNVAVGWNNFVDAPQKVMGQLLGGGRFEIGCLNSRRIGRA